AYGLSNLHIGAAGIALRGGGAQIMAGSDRVLTFNGSPATSIAPGGLAVSDPVELDAPALSDMAISVFLPGRMDDSFPITGHGNSRQTSYISDAGDFTAAGELPVAETTDSYLFVAGIDILAPVDVGGIVAIGDSLTDCNISSIDANNRWTNQLARRLVERHGDRAPSVMNQGIGGNRIVHDARGGSAQRRFDRDVLAQPGATHVIVLLGVNDIRNRGRKPEEEVTADEMIAGLHQLARRAQSNGLKVFGGTMLTYEDENFNPPPGMPGLYTPQGEDIRQEVNGWIRTGGAFDAVIDFETALADPAHPTRMLPEYDCGDHLHPSDAGYLRMGDIIDLTLFD
ncbi:MAG: SGNH/GDSL hydrolase family protein, partial [Rhodospirillales bacterium]|nr:SGNH/GDSL hydrolase family protein [Rhodospirillales bacterium]